jgi:hypothetical protein
MKKISLWATRHKWQARILIVVSFLLLNILGFYTGMRLSDTGVSLPVGFILANGLLYIGVFILYPFRNKRKTISYFRQKGYDLVLASSTFLMIVFLGNHPDQLFRYSPTLNAALSKSNTSLPGDSLTSSYKSLNEFTASMKNENGKLLKWKERKKLLKAQINAIKNSSEPSSGGKVALIILSVLVAAGLLYGVAALACSLSCGGSDAAAVVVGIGGAALVIFLLILAIKAILGKKKKGKITPSPAN